MKKFNCQCCNYQTDYPSNIKKHYATKRHHENTKILQNCPPNAHQMPTNTHQDNDTEIVLKSPIVFKCDHCQITYGKQYYLNRHLKNCTKKVINEKDNQIKDLLSKQEDLLLKQEDLLSKQEGYITKIRELELRCEDQLTENKQITNSVLKIAENQTLVPKKQVTTTQYIINNYKDAPNLEFPLVNWSNETMDNYVQLGPVKGLSKIITDHWVDNIPPEERSIWNIDYSRNKFIIRKDDSWIVDINGATFQEITIAKIYQHFIDYMQNSNRRASAMVDLMSFMCDIRNKDMGLKALKDAGKYLIYDNEKYQNEPPLSF